MAEIDWEQGEIQAPADTGSAIDWESGELSEPPKGKGLTGHARDLGLSALKSAIAVPEVAVGLADIPTGGRVGKALENEGGSFGFRPKQAKEFLGDLHTDQYKAQQQAFSEADGVLAKTGVALQNPSLIANTVTESIAPMFAGGVAARGLTAATRLGQMGVKGQVIAGAAGEGAVMAGSQAEGIRQETDDGLLTPAQSGAALATGALGSLFGYAGGRLAQRLGIGDVDTMLASGKLTRQDVAGELARVPAKSIPRQVVEGAITEGFLEELPQSISEQIIQNLALGKTWSEGVEDAAVMGTLAGMAMGGGASMASGFAGRGQQPATEPAPATVPAADTPAPSQTAAFSTGVAPFINENALSRAGVSTPVPAPIIDTESLDRWGANAPTPSQQLGLDPSAGPMSAAAALAVDTGAAGAMQQAAAQNVDAETGEIAQPRARAPEQKPQAQTPEQMRERMAFVEQQARTNGGWDRRLVDERNRLQAEIARVEPSADQNLIKNEAPADAGGLPAAPVVDQETGAVPTGSLNPVTNLLDPAGVPAASSQDQMARAGSIEAKSKDGVAEKPTATDAGSRWDTMDADARAAVLAQKGGWSAKSGLLNVPGKRLMGLAWGDIPEAARARLSPLMAAERVDRLLRAAGVDPDAPTDKAVKLRREAEILQKEARGMLDRIPPGQPVRSARDASLREKSAEKSRRAAELFKQAEELGAANTGAAPAATRDATSQVAGQQREFVSAPDGSVDFGEITPEMAAAMRRQPGKIRLERGDDSYGERHIELRHGEQIRGIGFASVGEFVADAVRHIDAVWRPSKSSQLVVVQSEEKGKAVFIALRPAEDGDYYTINTAFPVGDGYAERKKGWELLWGGASVPAVASGANPLAEPSPKAGATATMTPGQSNSSVAPASVEGNRKPKAEPRGILKKMAEAAAKARASYFTPGNVVEGYGGFDRVVRYQEPDSDGRWSVTVRAVERQGEAWADKPGERERTHATQPDARKLKAGPVGRVEVDAVPIADDKQADPDRDGAKPAIVDAGEKIGGSRKDTATAGRPRAKAVAEKDETPGWKKRYVAMQDMTTVANETPQWHLIDKRTGKVVRSGWQPMSFNSEAEAEAMIPRVEVARNHRAVPETKGEDGEYRYTIMRVVSDRKRVQVVEREFPSRDAAMEYMAEHAVEIIETRTSFGEEILPKPENVMREGPARREDDAKADDFLRDFGLRAVEFGNWNNQDERQEVMNHAYDALADLAETLNIPARSIGFDGELGLAFGARGQGLSGARAHYEPSYAAINLTKMSGAGSLAHEWFHALDHYFGRQDGKTTGERTKNDRGDMTFKAGAAPDSMVSHGFSRQDSGVREELRESYRKLIDTMFRKAEKFVEDTQKVERFVGEAKTGLSDELQKIRDHLAQQLDVRYYKRGNKPASAEQLAEFDSIAEKLIAGELLETEWRSIEGSKARHGTHRWTNDAMERLGEIYKAVRGRSGFNQEKTGWIDRIRGNMNLYGQRLKMLADAQQSTEKTRGIPTSFAMEAKSIDQGRASDYWTTPHEMAARAFQSYVEDKVAERGGNSQFLTYGTNKAVLTPWGWKRPFPTGDERVAINAAFDAFVGKLQAKETDKGVALFSFAGQSATTADRYALGSAMRRIAVGEDAEAVRQDTGWHRGADGMWRFEISDDQASIAAGGDTAAEILDAASLGESGGARVADVLDHPQLFAAYPHLENIRVELMPADNSATARLVRSPAGARLQVRGTVKRTALRSVMLHELQHAIQGAEGFATGGSARNLVSDFDKTGAETYRRLSGEVEARNTQTRMRMTPAMRQQVSPEMTADVPSDDVIVTFNGEVLSTAPQNMGSRMPVTERGLLRALRYQFPGLVEPTLKMLERGRGGKKGGLVVINSADPLRVAGTFSSKTGRALDDSIELFSAAGAVNGFFDPRSGLTFLVGPNLDPVTAPAVLLHEMIHGQQRQKIDAQAMAMLMNRSGEKDPALRGFLDRVAQRMVDADAAADSKEAAAYIVEQAVMEGRSRGYAVADSRFFAWADTAFGERLGNFLRGVAAMIRSWMIRHGGIKALTVDDLVGYAMGGVKRAARGEVTLQPSGDPIRASRAGAPVGETASRYPAGNGRNRLTPKEWIKHQLANHRGWAMGALTRDQIADIWGESMPGVKRFDEVVRQMDTERQRNAERADILIERWRKLPSEVADRVSDLMHRATLAKFDPDTNKGLLPPGDLQDIQTLWDTLPEPAKALYRDVRDTYADTLRAIRNGLADRAEQAGANGARVAAQIRLEFDKYLKEGPYFPLARFGDLIMIADKGDERMVETFESSAKRELRTRQLRAAGWTVKLTSKAEYSATKDGAAGHLIGEVLEKVNALDMPADQKANLMDNLNQLAISTLPDASYRRHFRHRKGVPGFSSDAMRAFAASMQHAGHHIAKIRHAHELSLLIDEMQKDIRDARGNIDTTEQQQVAAELTRRIDYLMNPNTHPVAAAAGQVGFVMSLGGSVASGLVNMTQTPFVTFPWLGAKFGFGKAGAALTKASMDYFGGKWEKWSGFVMAGNAKLTGDEQLAIRDLENQGIIDLTQAHDLAGTANTDSTVSKRAFAINRAMKIVGWTFHVPEVFNRQVSALAAYRLAREAGQDHVAAVETARQALIRTHFDYAASNRARAMQGNFTRVITMFKQYSQQMTYLLWRNAYLSLKGESPEVKREARRMLVGVAVMHFTAAGSLGLPLGLFGITPLLGLLAMAMGDEDDPWDWETEYRNMLADTFGANAGEALARGPMRLLLNVDLAGRVGLGDLWWRAPNKEAEGRDLVEAWMLNLLGPVAGYAGQMGTAAQAFEEGKFARGVESMMPKFISSPLKAYRYGDEGVRSWRGDDLGVDLTPVDVLGTALGFQPTRLAEMYEGRAAIKGREGKLQARRQEIVNMWVSARLAGDADGAMEAIEAVRKFNSVNPEIRITLDTLHRSMRTKRRNAAQIENGAYLPASRDYLRDQGRFANVE